MKRRFFLESNDCGEPWVPRECNFLCSKIAIPTGQKLFHVTVSPPFSGTLAGREKDVCVVLLGPVENHWKLNDVGKPGFMVDIYVCKTERIFDRIDVQHLIRIGVGKVHKSWHEANKALGG